ncbi:MAG: glucosylceramidase [Halanaerobiales bacterium]|nr:glucosylceramidase [Halanaerobiales bacterium]
MFFKRYISVKDSNKKLSKTSFKNLNNKSNNKIIIDDTKTYQSIIGFGGAFTEAACYTLDKVSKKTKNKVLKAYFDQENGLGYNLGRISINSCDFSLKNYTYVQENDKTLSTFDISREEKWTIPTIINAKDIRGGEIKLLASPWSPPPWMKTNNNMNNGGKLLKKYYQSWANYYVKFIDEFKKRDIAIWGVTVQNEPAAVQSWDSCIYSAEEEKDFIKNYLGPTLKNNNLNNIKILFWDHNRDKIINRATTVLSDKKAAKYIWGTALHWYLSEDFKNVGEVHKRFPNKHLLFTEGTQENGLHIGSWKTGERYARNMIGDLNNWVRGYIDWNLFLDELGGPNHVKNYCDAPIIINTNNDQVIFNSSYYYIGHFSKFIKENALRINSKVNNKKLKVAAFKNPNKEVVVVILNESNQKINFKLKYKDTKINNISPKRSIQSILISGGIQN